MSAYPVPDRAREAAAKAAIRREARPIESSSDSSETESSSNSDSSSNSSSSSKSASPVEELQEEEMVDPEVTEGPFTRRLPPHPVKCAVCKEEKEKGSTKHDPNHTRIPGECRYPKCNGCKFGRHMDHHQHTRIAGECRMHGIPKIIWRCQACRTGNIKLAHTDPTYDRGACRFHGVDPRRQGTPRTGHHPRDPAIHPTDDPTQAKRIDPQHDEEDEKIITMAKEEKEHKKRIREQKRKADAETQAGGSLDWSKYKIDEALQILQSHRTGAIRKQLRLLHIRWYHAGITRMTNILRAAGIREEVLKMIPATVNTCRACRSFRRPAYHSVATSRMPTQFNERVQHDVLYLIANKPTTIYLWTWWTAQRLWSWFYPSVSTLTHPDDQHRDPGSSSSTAPPQKNGQGSSSSTAKDPAPKLANKWPDNMFKQEPCSHIMDLCTRLSQAERIPIENPILLSKFSLESGSGLLVHPKY